MIKRTSTIIVFDKRIQVQFRVILFFLKGSVLTLVILRHVFFVLFCFVYVISNLLIRTGFILTLLIELRRVLSTVTSIQHSFGMEAN